MRPWVVLCACVGCAPTAPIPDFLDHADGGVYSGELHFDAKAKLGPVRLARDTCDTPMDITFSPWTSPSITGSVACTLDTLGDVTASLDGDVTALPFVAGSLTADPVSGDFDGWFVDADTLHVESSGKVRTDQGITVVYDAVLDAVLVDPLNPMGG